MIGRSAVAFLLIPVFGFSAACFAAPAAWLLADLFLIPTCFGCIRSLPAGSGPLDHSWVYMPRESRNPLRLVMMSLTLV